MNPTKTVQEIYAAFGRGDIPAILDRLDPDVEWGYGPATTDVPWLLPRRGKAGAVAFFEALGQVEFHRFEPKRFLASDRTVLAFVHVEATYRSTGIRVVGEEEVHIWHFGPDGNVRKWRNRVDSHRMWMAYHGITESEKVTAA
jgi:hypothetical protein